MPRPYARLTTADLRTMADLYNKGWTADRIAAGLGCGATTVLHHLRAMGVEIRPRGKRPGQRGGRC